METGMRPLGGTVGSFSGHTKIILTNETSLQTNNEYYDYFLEQGTRIQ